MPPDDDQPAPTGVTTPEVVTVRHDSRSRLVAFMGSESALLRPGQRLVRLVLHLLIGREHFRHLELPHPFGIVIHARTTLHGTVRIYQGVTLGKNSLKDRHGAPTVEDGVVIFPGAVVIGPVTIGEGAVIGANSVVTADVGPYEVVAGAPARHVRTLEGFYDHEVVRLHALRKAARG